MFTNIFSEIKHSVYFHFDLQCLISQKNMVGLVGNRHV